MTIFVRDPLDNPEELVRRVYAYVAYRMGDGPDAEDVTSDAFERALRFRASYDSQKGEPAAWLIGIARRCIADASRAPHPGEAPDVAAPGNLEEEAVQRLSLAEAIAALGERDRELIALRYGADLTARQIGRIFGKRTNTVEVALYRALARLRGQLATSTPVTPRPAAEPAEPALQPVRIWAVPAVLGSQGSIQEGRGRA